MMLGLGIPDLSDTEYSRDLRENRSSFLLIQRARWSVIPLFLIQYSFVYLFTSVSTDTLRDTL